MLGLGLGLAEAPLRRRRDSPLDLPGAQFSRAQLEGVEVMSPDANGIWRPYAANQPIFGADGRLLFGRAVGTNLIRNPRPEGVVPGSVAAGGEIATFWVIRSLSNAIVTVVGSGVENGLSYVEFDYVGTGTHSGELGFESISAIPVAGSTAYTLSSFIKVSSGDFTGISTALLRLRTDSPSFNYAGQSFSTATGAALGSQRFVNNVTTNSDAVAGRAQIVLGGSASAAIRLRVANPLFEIGSVATLPKLPPIGAPAISTAGQDVLTAPLSALGIGANGACTILWSGVADAVAPNGFVQVFVSVYQDALNWLAADANQGATAVRAARRTAGTVSSSNAGTFVPGTPFRFGMTLDGTGRNAVSFGGGAPAVVTGGPTAALTTMGIGGVAGQAVFRGGIAPLQILPYAVSDAELQARVAALPLT